MICCACFKAEVEGYLIAETDPNIYWAMCQECMEGYNGQIYLLEGGYVE
jgi:hypothetical protein